MRGADKGTLVARNGYLVTGGGQMSPARLLRLAGLVSVAAGVLLVVAQLLGALAFVVVDGDPVRHARSGLVGVNGLLTLLAVYLLLLGLVGLYARQSAASGTLGLVGFLVAVLSTMLLAGAWWLEAFAVPYAADEAPALVAEPPTGRLLAGGTVSFGVFALGWVLFGVASVRARVFPRDAAILLIIGGLVGLLIAVVPGAGVPLALAVGWMGMWLLRSDRGGQAERRPPRRR
jgi:hypothetical protein